MATQTAPEVIREAAALVVQMRSVQLATVGSDGAPLASYAPFVHLDGALYVYLSSLAQHAQNLRTTPLLSAMLIRDEGICAEIFARPRLVLDCKVSTHAREGELFSVVLDRFEAQFGETAGVVRELSDFTLFGLRPHAARLVSGFARAAKLDCDAIAVLFDAAFSDSSLGGKE